MKNHKIYQIGLILLIIIIINCQPKVQVRIDDFESSMGGKNSIVSIQNFPVSIENNTKVTMYHIEEWDVKKNFKHLSVNREFHFYSQLNFIIKLFFTPLTLGYVWAILPHEFHYENIYAYNKDFKILPGYIYHEFFESLDKFDYSILITIVNNGDIPIKEEFTVVDVLPDFLEFQSVEYLSDGDIKEVAYDLHKNENSQVIPFKIRPINDGLRPMQSVKLKIHFKPNIQKFKVNKYNPNITTTLPIDKELKPSEANPDSTKDTKVEEKSESKTSPSKDTKIMPADTNDIPKSTNAKEIERKSETKKNSTEEKSTTEEDSSKKTKVEKTKSKGKKK